MKISKSLSLKCNLGNYTMADFFVSAEAECNESEMYQAGQSLHEYCKKELTKDVNATKKYLQDLANGKVEEVTIKATIQDDTPRSFHYTDPATELADGEWNVPAPQRNDKRV